MSGPGAPHPARRRLVLGAAALPLTLSACAKAQCGASAVGKAKDVSEIVAGAPTFKTIGPWYFGFNYELFEVQRSFWDEARHAPYEQPLELMRAFPGAVYRFPGGSMANQYDWRAGMGDVATRKGYRVYDWTGAWLNTLGLREYLAWVRAVDGEVWYIINISGRYREELPVPALQDETRQLVAAVAELDPDPARGVMRWELGNELDRDVYQWRPEKYVARARAVGEALREADPRTGIVLMMQEYATLAKKDGISDADYNGLIVRSLKDLSIEYSKHLYYDGAPGGPPIPFRIGKLCDSIALLDGEKLDDARIWITEHARWPEEAKGKAWETQWYKSANLAAAVSVADLMIAATQLPRVKSAFVHSIHGSPGPWPLLHRHEDGRFVGSAVYFGLLALREHLLEDVLPTETRSTNYAGYPGNYDVRAAVLASADRSRHAIWAVNRQSRSAEAVLTIPALAGRRVTMRRSFVGGETSELDNYRSARVGLQRDRVDLAFDAQGTTRLSLPPNGVVGVSNG